MLAAWISWVSTHAVPSGTPAPLRWNPPVDLSSAEARLCDRPTSHRRFYRFLRLHRHRLFDEAFQDGLAARYSDTPRGNPPLPPARRTAVVQLQAYADVSDEGG